MRYILAKVTQFVDERAWGSVQPHDDLNTFVNNKVDVEHILPQKPSCQVVEAFDKADAIKDYTHRFGNLTLVEKTINCSVGNGLFQEKQEAYKQSKFLVTKTLGENVSVGVNTAVDRAVRNLLSFEKWTSCSIEKRQGMLIRLAHEVWDMPVSEEAQA